MVRKHLKDKITIDHMWPSLTGCLHITQHYYHVERALFNSTTTSTSNTEGVIINYTTSTSNTEGVIINFTTSTSNTEGVTINFD